MVNNLKPVNVAPYDQHQPAVSPNKQLSSEAVADKIRIYRNRVNLFDTLSKSYDGSPEERLNDMRKRMPSDDYTFFEKRDPHRFRALPDENYERNLSNYRRNLNSAEKEVPIAYQQQYDYLVELADLYGIQKNYKEGEEVLMRAYALGVDVQAKVDKRIIEKPNPIGDDRRRKFNEQAQKLYQTQYDQFFSSAQSRYTEKRYERATEYMMAAAATVQKVEKKVFEHIFEGIKIERDEKQFFQLVDKILKGLQEDYEKMRSERGTIENARVSKVK